MGGHSYARAAPAPAPSGGGGGYRAPVQSSQAAAAALAKQRSFSPEYTPMHKAYTSDAKTPIVVALDISGSMSTWPRILYDKLPMFFGQLVMQEYAEGEPAEKLTSFLSFTPPAPPPRSFGALFSWRPCREGSRISKAAAA